MSIYSSSVCTIKFGHNRTSSKVIITKYHLYNHVYTRFTLKQLYAHRLLPASKCITDCLKVKEIALFCFYLKCFK